MASRRSHKQPRKGLSTKSKGRTPGHPTHATPGHLRNAPITEALIELHAEYPPGVGLEQVAAVQDRFRDAYPDRRNRIAWVGRFDLGNDTQPPSVPERRHDGFLFTSPDRIRVVQVRVDGFAMHWMRPYDTWESLRDEARRRWDDVCATLRPVRIHRIAVRYVNRIDLPMPVSEIRDWVLTEPELAPAIGRPMNHFFMQMNVPFVGRDATCTITETVDYDPARVPSQHAGFIFDIDVSRVHDYPVATPEVWKALEDLRAIKNEVFFKSITPRTKRLFQ